MSDPPTRPSLPAPLDVVQRHWLLLAVLIVALALRVRGLGEWWLNPDEGIYYSVLSREDFAGFWSEVSANAHPPLYYVLLRVLGVFTWDFLWFRTFSLVCGLAAVVGVWAVARELGGSRARASVAGLLAALPVALSPRAIELSQVMRPYMLQLALLCGGLCFLLRYQRIPSRRNLGVYLTFLVLALLAHYSSVLGVGAVGLVVVHDGMQHGFGRPEWKRLAASHVVPLALLMLLYAIHLRGFAGSTLADTAFDGWLSFYMVDSPSQAWLGFLGFQSLVATEWLRGPAALLLLAALAASVLARDLRPALLAGGALAAGVAGAALGAYPFGATRHSVWLLAFTVPALGWLGAYTLGLSRRTAAMCIGVVAAVVATGGPLGRALGTERAPWAPTDQVLKRVDLARMVDVLDPDAEPDLVIMSAQTFYLLVPFYPSERERSVFSRDSSLFHFPYGTRRMLVAEAWDFTAGKNASGSSHLAHVLALADEAFPDVSLGNRERAVLLVGGWRPPLIDELAALSGAEPVVMSAQSVPGLFSFLLNLPALRRAFAGAASSSPSPPRAPPLVGKPSPSR